MIVLTCTQEKDEHKAKLFVYAHEEKREKKKEFTLAPNHMSLQG